MRKSKQQKGFTLTELLVIVAIFISITTLTLPNFFTRSKKKDLEGFANRLKSQIIEMSSSVKSGQSFNKSIPSGESVPDFNHYLTGIGIRFTLENYTFFQIWTDEEGNLASYEDTPDFRKVDHEFPNYLIINHFYPDKNEDDIIEIHYLRNQEEVISLDGWHENEITISLSIKGEDYESVLHINSLGLCYLTQGEIS